MRIIHLKKMRWAGLLAYLREITNKYMILFLNGRALEKKTLA
jgi:hypothetical protein